MMRKATAALGVASLLLMIGGALAEGPVVGVSWANFQEERWKIDEAAMKAVINDAGGTYISVDAQSNASKQLTDVEGLISQGVDVLVISAQDGSAIDPAVTQALAENIPVIFYERQAEYPDAFYIGFDNSEIGRIQAREILKAQPSGNYVFIKGSPTDPNALFAYNAQMEVLKAHIDSGAIRVVGDAFSENWLPANAQRNMEQFLAANDNKIDAVVCTNDGMAGGVIAALDAQGMAGAVPVSGTDGEHAALNRVALGTQTVSVWKNVRTLGKTAGEIALALAAGTPKEKIPGMTMFDGGPKGIAMPTVLLNATPITKDNLHEVVDAGWISKEELCSGVAKGTVAICD